MWSFSSSVNINFWAGVPFTLGIFLCNLSPFLNSTWRNIGGTFACFSNINWWKVPGYVQMAPLNLPAICSHSNTPWSASLSGFEQNANAAYHLLQDFVSLVFALFGDFWYVVGWGCCLLWQRVRCISSSFYVFCWTFGQQSHRPLLLCLICRLLQRLLSVTEPPWPYWISATSHELVIRIPSELLSRFGRDFGMLG